MPSGQYHVGITNDPEHYLEGKHTKNGYFSHKANQGKARILYAFKGDYKVKLKCFGGKKFSEMMKKRDGSVELMINMMT